MQFQLSPIRKELIFTKAHLEKVVTDKKALSEDAQLDLIVASISIKYTQSNSVGYATKGMTTGEEITPAKHPDSKI